MEFEEFLKSKKIDPDLFRKGDHVQFAVLKELYDQVHPSSFVQQKLFLINKIRRSYQLKAEDMAPPVAKPAKIKPKIIPKKPKTG